MKFNTYQSNIWKYTLFSIFDHLTLFYPIWQLFYLGRGLNVTQIALLGVIWSVTVLILEIPSSLLADRWSRKNTLMISSIFFLIDVIIVIFSRSFIIFAIAVLCHGIYHSFRSGTSNAFFYDTLKELKKENEYEKIKGRISLYVLIPTLFATAAAGFIFKIKDTLPYIISAIAIAISIIIIFFLKEPNYHKHIKKTKIFDHIKDSFKVAFKKERLSFIILIGLIIFFAFDYIYKYIQLYFNAVSVPIVLFGILFAGKEITQRLGNFFAHKFKKYNYKTIFTSIIISIVICILLMSLIKSYISIIFFFILFFISGVFTVIQRGYMHREISSHNRATVESIVSFMAVMVAIIFEPIAGRIIDTNSIFSAFFILGIILGIYMIYYLIWVLPKKKLFN